MTGFIVFAVFCMWLLKNETTRFVIMKMLQGFFKMIAFILVSPGTIFIVMFIVLYWGGYQ
jgi:hypothetical protein